MLPKRNINNGNHVLFMCSLWCLLYFFLPVLNLYVHYFLPNMKPSESINRKLKDMQVFLLECKEEIFLSRIIFISCWIHDWERVSCFLDLSAGCLLLYTLTHRPMWCRFRFQFVPFCLREGLKKSLSQTPCRISRRYPLL